MHTQNSLSQTFPVCNQLYRHLGTCIRLSCVAVLIKESLARICRSYLLKRIPQHVLDLMKFSAKDILKSHGIFSINHGLSTYCYQYICKNQWNTLRNILNKFLITFKKLFHLFFKNVNEGLLWQLCIFFGATQNTLFIKCSVKCLMFL